MKNSKKVMFAAMGALLTGFGAVAVAMNSNKGETVSTVDTNNISFVTKNFGTDAGAAPAAGSETSSSINVSDMILKGIQSGGASLIGAAASEVGKIAFNALLKEMGFDTRTVQEKQFDKISSQIDQLQKSLEKGFTDVEKRIVEIHNKDIMSGILDKLKSVQTPITSKMAVVADIAAKELGKHDDAELKKEKDTFFQGLGELKFEKLSENNLWNATQALADSITVPYQADKSLKLFDLYEATYGSSETWDYMTIAPRKQFITYIAYMVNSLCELAKLEASYKMSQFKAGDSNLKDYENGVSAMIKSVNSMNQLLKDELDKLDVIQKDHDVNHIMTHRDRIVEKNGNITVKKGISVSSRLLPVTPGDNDNNYISYNYTGKNPYKVLSDLGGQTSINQNVIYTLDCNAQKDLYKTIIAEYKEYNANLGKTNFSDFTVKDYLKTAGFTYNEKDKEGFDKAKGFYRCIATGSYKGSHDNLWSTEEFNDLRVWYYDFDKADDTGNCYSTYSKVKYYKDGWFADGQWSSTWTSEMGNYYLCFLDTDQKTILGDLTKNAIENVNSETAKGDKYSRHFKGHRTIDTKPADTKVKIDS